MFASLEEDQGYVALGIAPSGLMVRFLVTLLFSNIRWLLAEPSFQITSCPYSVSDLKRRYHLTKEAAFDKHTKLQISRMFK